MHQLVMNKIKADEGQVKFRETDSSTKLHQSHFTTMQGFLKST